MTLDAGKLWMRGHAVPLGGVRGGVPKQSLVVGKEALRLAKAVPGGWDPGQTV